MRRFFSLVLLATLVLCCNKLELLEHTNPLEAGCLHPEATNYEATAISDNGSCTFGNCSIASVSTTSEYTLISPAQTTFSYNDSYTLGFNPGLTTLSQAESAALFLNETEIYSFGNWLTFPNYERTFTFTALFPPSNCYTIRLFKNDWVLITDPFTIY